MKPSIIVTGITITVLVLLWLGFQIKPQSFSPFAGESGKLQTVPLPDGLPAPVEKFYRAVYGNQVPVIETVVIKGRASVAPFGVMLPARFIFVHEAGMGYRHYIEATWYGIPFMKVNERYLDGKSFFEPPIGDIINDDPSTNQAANLALWAEALWFPSIWVTDSRASWQAVDDTTALLFVPFEDTMENFVVRFNPETGMIDSMEAMRYRDAGPDAEKILWINQSVPGETIPGTSLSAAGSATWLDQGKPWAIFTLEEIDLNVNVQEYIRRTGP